MRGPSPSRPDQALTVFRKAAADLQPGQDFPPELYRGLSLFLQRDAAHRFLLPTLALHGDEHLLDLGCGDGKVSAELLLPQLPRGSVTGVDINQQAIADATRDYQRVGKNIEFFVGDIEQVASVVTGSNVLSKPSCRGFDVIMSNFTLHWVNALETAMGEMRKIVAPAGRMVHLCSSGEAFPELFRAAHQVLQTPKWKKFFDEGTFRHPLLRTFSEVEKALTTSGFKLRSGGEQSVWHTFPNDIVLAAWVGIMPRPLIVRVPEERRSEFGKDVASAYRQQLTSISDYPKLSAREIAVRHNMMLFEASA